MQQYPKWFLLFRKVTTKITIKSTVSTRTITIKTKIQDIPKVLTVKLESTPVDWIMGSVRNSQKLIMTDTWRRLENRTAEIETSNITEIPVRVI